MLSKKLIKTKLKILLNLWHRNKRYKMKENINEDETFRQNHELACDVAGTITNMLNHYMLNTMLVNFKNAGPIIEGINMAAAHMIGTMLVSQRESSDNYEIEELADMISQSFKEKIITRTAKMAEEWEKHQRNTKKTKETH